MKRKNLIARKKAKKNKLLIKDTKILNFYKKFKSIVYKVIKRKNFALAVSGGPDSLCMAYFAKMYSLEFNNKIHPLIVDHRLRRESTHEAFKVKKILLKKKYVAKFLNGKETYQKVIYKKTQEILDTVYYLIIVLKIR